MNTDEPFPVLILLKMPVCSRNSYIISALCNCGVVFCTGPYVIIMTEFLSRKFETPSIKSLLQGISIAYEKAAYSKFNIQDSKNTEPGICLH
jgi:hypothetical protein